MAFRTVRPLACCFASVVAVACADTPQDAEPIGADEGAVRGDDDNWIQQALTDKVATTSSNCEDVEDMIRVGSAPLLPVKPSTEATCSGTLTHVSGPSFNWKVTAGSKEILNVDGKLTKAEGGYYLDFLGWKPLNMFGIEKSGRPVINVKFPKGKKSTSPVVATLVINGKVLDLSQPLDKSFFSDGQVKQGAEGKIRNYILDSWMVTEHRFGGPCVDLASVAGVVTSDTGSCDGVLSGSSRGLSWKVSRLDETGQTKTYADATATLVGGEHKDGKLEVSIKFKSNKTGTLIIDDVRTGNFRGEVQLKKAGAESPILTSYGCL